MNKVLKTNIFMFIGLIVNVGLIIFPFAVLYVLAIIIYIKIAAGVLLIALVAGKIVFDKIRNDEDTEISELFLGGIGGIIAVNTVNKGYGGREKVYVGFSMMIWFFAVYPLVFWIIIHYANLGWLPSV